MFERIAAASASPNSRCAPETSLIHKRIDSASRTACSD